MEPGGGTFGPLCHFERIDAGSGWTSAAGLDHGGDDSWWTAEDRLHASVRPVTDMPGEAAPLGFPAGPIAKADALHPAADHHGNGSDLVHEPCPSDSSVLG